MGPAPARPRPTGRDASLEFKGTFSGANNQHVGFGVDFNNSPNWAMFSVKFDGTFNARTAAGSIVPATETQLPSNLIGSAARLPDRVGTPTEVRYYVDGALVAEHTPASTSAPPRCARSPATSPTATPATSGWTGCT